MVLVWEVGQGIFQLVAIVTYKLVSASIHTFLAHMPESHAQSYFARFYIALHPDLLPDRIHTTLDFTTCSSLVCFPP